MNIGKCIRNMKINRVVSKVEENFPTERTKIRHYNSHTTDDGVSINTNPHNIKDYEFTTYEYENANEYEKAANEFAMTQLSDTIDEFYGNDNRLHKYDHATGKFVVYNINNVDKNNPIIYTYYIMSENRWERDNKEHNPNYSKWKYYNVKYNPYTHR